MALTNNVGVCAALECVGTDEAIATAVNITRPGGMIGAVGLPLYNNFDYKQLFWKNVGIRGGVASAREYIPILLEEILKGTINPGIIFDYRTDLENISSAYEAMDKRVAIKSLIKISEV